MKTNRIILCLMLALTACTQALSKGTPTPVVPSLTPTSNLPTPIVLTTSQPDVAAAVSAFLDAWKKFDHPAMYALISKEAQAGISEADFSKLYSDTENALTLAEINYVAGPNSTQQGKAALGVRINYKSNLFGEFTRDQTINLVMEDGAWKLIWNDSLVMPEMGGGNRLSIEYSVPERASIFDSTGLPLASPTKVVALGIVPGKINPNTEQAQNILLSELTGKKVEDIYASYVGAAADWYIPVGEATVESVDRNKAELSSFPGIMT
ncbi:MAG TPA: NTF2-like N-terminal transpeptidase domain-containing protein, partial [Leptolinea sp.]